MHTTAEAEAIWSLSPGVLFSTSFFTSRSPAQLSLFDSRTKLLCSTLLAMPIHNADGPISPWNMIDILGMTTGGSQGESWKTGTLTAITITEMRSSPYMGCPSEQLI